MLFHEEFLLPAWAQPNRFVSLGKNLKIVPGKNPGIKKVRVEKDCRERNVCVNKNSGEPLAFSPYLAVSVRLAIENK